jgi:hypothetical protein
MRTRTSHTSALSNSAAGGYERAIDGRRLALCAFAMVVTLASNVAVAQTTSDGVAAFERGDYAAAASILRPIAERFPRHDDATAQFLMAQMYEAGRGVAMDRVRAYALYARASMNRAHPRLMDAMEHARDLYFSLERRDAERGELLVNLGFHHGFEPATFELEPGQSVTVDLGEVVIRNGADERHVRVHLAPAPGMVFLPLNHTELVIDPARGTRRHFIEVFAWRPDAGSVNWTLFAQVIELIRTEWVPITILDELATSTELDPPRNVEVHDRARLRVVDGGAVEAVVVAGAHPRTEHIESDAERRDRIESARVRDDVLRRIDWAVVRDVRRTPRLSYADGDGCANIFLFGWTMDRTEVITVRADEDLLQLSNTAQAFDLSVPRIGLEVTVHVFHRALRSWPFCTDVGQRYDVPPELWRAVGGTVTIEVSRTTDGRALPMRATVRIDGSEFVRDDGVRVRQTRPVVLTGLVGRSSG